MRDSELCVKDVKMNLKKNIISVYREEVITINRFGV